LTLLPLLTVVGGAVVGGDVGGVDTTGATGGGAVALGVATDAGMAATGCWARPVGLATGLAGAAADGALPCPVAGATPAEPAGVALTAADRWWRTMTSTMVGGVVGCGFGPLGAGEDPAGWLSPRADMMPNIVEALRPAANVRAAAAR
jgi:hypothetical protein